MEVIHALIQQKKAEAKAEKAKAEAHSRFIYMHVRTTRMPVTKVHRMHAAACWRCGFSVAVCGEDGLSVFGWTCVCITCRARCRPCASTRQCKPLPPGRPRTCHLPVARARAHGGYDDAGVAWRGVA